MTDADLAQVAQVAEETIRATGASQIQANEIGAGSAAAAATARRGRVSSLRERLPGLRVAGGLRGCDRRSGVQTRSFDEPLRRAVRSRAAALRHRAGDSLGAIVVRAAGAARPGVRADPILRTRALDREFPTPFGIAAAGFDKNATMLLGLGALGFGHVEVGTVTPKAAARKPEAAPRAARRRPCAHQPDGLQQRGHRSHGRSAARCSQRRTPPRGRRQHRQEQVAPPESAADDYRAAALELAPTPTTSPSMFWSPNTPGPLRAAG